MNDYIAKEHAYAITMAVNTMVTAMGMVAENKQREIEGKSMAYTEQQFTDLILTNGCHHNGVLSLNWHYH